MMFGRRVVNNSKTSSSSRPVTNNLYYDHQSKLSTSEVVTTTTTMTTTTNTTTTATATTTSPKSKSSSTTKLIAIFYFLAGILVVTNIWNGHRITTTTTTISGGSGGGGDGPWSTSGVSSVRSSDVTLADASSSSKTQSLSKREQQSPMEQSSSSSSTSSISSQHTNLPPLPSFIQHPEPTHHACDNFNGIYHIQMGDIGGAAGTIFFQFVIGQLIYAELYNYKPWVFLNNVSYVIYDPIVHGRGPGVNVTMLHGMEVSYIPSRPNTKNLHWRDSIPGPPILGGNNNNHDNHTASSSSSSTTKPKLVTKQYHFDGMGVWDDYFEPVSDFIPGDRSCTSKPLLTMDLYLITPGIHGFAPWAPKCWRYQYLPDYVTKPHIPLQQWLEPQRIVANRVLTKYIRLKPLIQQQAYNANPSCSFRHANSTCLGIHIRHSDKAAGRRVIQTDEFLPFVEEFISNGGLYVYLATDAQSVITHINTNWPSHVTSRIRTIGNDIVRSTDAQAVFDIGGHHRTNTEILIEILALSYCQFIIHGLSAVTETSIWMNINLHYTSVNLEDVDHLQPKQFGGLVHGVLSSIRSNNNIDDGTSGKNITELVIDHRNRIDKTAATTSDWYLETSTTSKRGENNESYRQSMTSTTSHAACDVNNKDSGNGGETKKVKGILHIAHVGETAGTGTAFFTSILNQLIYAEMHNLTPWIHLGNDSSYIYDELEHSDKHGAPPRSEPSSVTNQENINANSMNFHRHYNSIMANTSFEVGVDYYNQLNLSTAYPSVPILRDDDAFLHDYKYFAGNGIWESYFQPVSDYVPGDASCKNVPMVRIKSDLVMPGLHSWCPWAVRAWRYDDVPYSLWQPENMTLREFVEPMRLKGHEVVKKYYRFRPHIVRRAEQVNPSPSSKVGGSDSTSWADVLPCLAVHIRNSDKRGKYRNKFPPTKFREYMQAFAMAGGRTIYVATDSHRILEYIEQHFPSQLKRIIRTQGPYVVRSTKKWPIHELERHHRTNSEVLVDILAMSHCDLLLHGNSAVSEAAIYLNPNLHNHSVNWEDKDRMTIQQFRELSRKILLEAVNGNATMLDMVVTPPPRLYESQIEAQDQSKQQLHNVTIVKGGDRHCRKNAIVYLAQKRHSTYDRDSYGILLESLELMYKNYLSLDDHRNNADVLIFHTADFDGKDLDAFESRFGTEFRKLITLVDIANTHYWKRPKWHESDNPNEWYAYPLFSEGYRKMMHWFAIDIWNFFADHAKNTGCSYDYIMRFDEDSFLHSPIRYDIFDFMKGNGYNYGFRLCSYEMQVTQRIFKLWRKSRKGWNPIREIDLEMCGVYNNFFVAKLDFFQSSEVTQFLKFVDRQGMIYRRRLGDLMIHSMSIYAFARPETIHRFLDFTYEHGTVDPKSGCIGKYAKESVTSGDVSFSLAHSRLLTKFPPFHVLQ